MADTPPQPVEVWDHRSHCSCSKLTDTRDRCPGDAAKIRQRISKLVPGVLDVDIRRVSTMVVDTLLRPGECQSSGVSC